MGARAPGMLSTVKAFMAVDEALFIAGAKAAAEPIRREVIARFIILDFLEERYELRKNEQD